MEAELGEPAGCASAFRRPDVIVQSETFNRSKLATIVCVVLTSQLKWAEAPGNLMLTERDTGLPKPSVANVTQLVTLDRDVLTERVGKLPKARMDAVLGGIDLMLGRAAPAPR